MVTISLCMIVKNEEEVLARCLDSVSELVDEIIIVDTGSDDRTVEIAKAYTEHVYEFKWIDDFAAARNYSFAKATKEYCMWLDADDIVDRFNQQQLIKLKEEMQPDVDVVMMKYNIAFDDQDKATFSYYRERLIRNDGTRLWQGAVHEAITPSGKIIYNETAISHKKIGTGDPDRNLRIYQKMLDRGEVLEARHRYYYARELYYHQLYKEAVTELSAFLEMEEGWVENKIEACELISQCFSQLGSHDEALLSLFESFQFDAPRAEICCSIGRIYFEKEKYQLAVYWYKQALAVKAKVPMVGFVSPDCYNYIPYLQLCVCYDRLGDYQKAQMYNELAGKCKPNSKAYLQNRDYFRTKNMNVQI